MNDDKTRIPHINEHSRRILMMLQDITEEHFYNSPTLVDAVSFNFAVLGEAAARFPRNCATVILKFHGEQ